MSEVKRLLIFPDLKHVAVLAHNLGKRVPHVTRRENGIWKGAKYIFSRKIIKLIILEIKET